MIALIIQALGIIGPAAIQYFEAKFGGGTGPAKKAGVSAIFQALLEALVKSGQIPKVDPDQIDGALEALLAALKATGVITSSPGSTTNLPAPTVKDGVFTYQVPAGTVPMRVTGGVMFLPQSTMGQQG